MDLKAKEIENLVSVKKKDKFVSGEGSGKGTEVKVPSIMLRKDFNISGKIGDFGKREGSISFTSLVHQVENAIKVGYENYEIVEACIKAIEPGSKLRFYLESKPDLTFPVLRKILRSHFGEPSATELYRQLNSAVQEPRETPQQFLVRVIDLRQKIIFASQESESEMNYDISLVQNMFLHALMTGFSDDNIKSDMKAFLSDKTVSHETLFEQLNKATNSVNERKKKLQSASRTARINEIWRLFKL